MNENKRMSLATVETELNIADMEVIQAGSTGKTIGCGCLGAAAEIACAMNPVTWIAVAAPTSFSI